MNFMGCFFILIIGSLTLSINAFNEYDLYKRHPNLNLMKIVASSRSLLQINPSSTTEQCFNDYMELLNSSSDKYELSYKSCLDTSQAERKIAEEATIEDRELLYKQAKASCDLIRPCKEVKTAVEEFECYAKSGSANIQPMKSISSEATILLSDLKDQYRLIANKENRCTRDAKRTFDLELDDAYEDLNECIQASLPVIPTRAPMY